MTHFAVYAGADPEPVCIVGEERSARGLVESANANDGHPDLNYFSDDVLIRR